MEALNTYTVEETMAETIIRTLKELKMNKAELALRINYSRSAVSQYLNGKYASDPKELESKLQGFLDQVAQSRKEVPQTETDYGSGNSRTVFLTPVNHTALKPKTQYFENRDFNQTIGVCKACQDNMALGIVVGKSGQGKTHALRKYAQLPRVAYIECDDTMACRDMVEAIETQLGIPRGAGGTIWARVKRIREFFNVNEGYLLIVDEADKLISKYTQKKMEILRGIFDQAEVGIIIAGEPRLEAEIKGHLERFANRMDFYYKLKGLNRAEVVDYLEGYEIDDAAMEELVRRAINPQNGCFRLLDRTLNNVLRILKDRGQTKMTMKILSEASAMMML